MDKRTLLAVVLSIIVLLVYQNFFAKPPVKTTPAPTEQTAPATPQTAAAPPAATAPAPSAPTTAAPAAAIQTGAAARITATPSVAGAERDVVVETPLYRAV